MAKVAVSYGDAIAHFRLVEERERGLPIHARCRSTLMSHGAKVERAVVYFHGFTSCPAQGMLLGLRLFELGLNVYLPRMLGHGGTDRLNLDG